MVVRKEEGFTLIELIVTLAILGIVIGVYSSLYYSGYKSFSSTQNSVDVEQNVRFAMNYIVSLLEKGPSEVEIIDNGRGLSIKQVLTDRGYRDYTITLEKPILYTHIKESDTDSRGSKLQLAVNIYDFMVTKKSNNMINIQIIGQSDDNGSNRFSLSTDVFLRKSDINVQ
ncbi:PilW family protein [Caldanaerobacter subterraneus]|uniref:N-terminal cleavage protein n=2 Tax=Caldanaerobacter subterraneus TaxID=911092 RepID=U5CRT7_CALSX|nr:prepilin-type N-terminal cleavage/methylation domain-containing protein [Caldanaerobacter subterraneus]ERM91671.1 N-terminal cleavage protein [Caldanaerobacter subterraneus subsp. yonseiensis KB-1]TCO68404.1 prepilin-type N-terminal cleavage/methylation domain-containing protein [Caldanaerobacter subterraneus]